VSNGEDSAIFDDEHQASARFFTVGHSTRTRDEFIALLEEFEIDLVADVRAFPRSRTNPQFNADTFAVALAEAGIVYRHLSALGGRRHRAKAEKSATNALWRNESFHNYADYASTEPFRIGLDELHEIAHGRHCAIMCAEAVWWRCHRRIIADYLLAAGTPVTHILGTNKSEPAVLTPGAELLSNGTLAYPSRNERTD
jgi:uncharacterized protein (DUF488 family)